MTTVWKSVGISRYKGDTNGTEQFMSEFAANRVLDLIELVSREPGCRLLTVNEGRRTRERQKTLRNRFEAYLKGGPYAPLAAILYTSRHDEILHGNAADLGGPDGEVLNAAEIAAIQKIGPRIGVRFTGLTFTPPEPWHVEADETPYQRQYFPIVIPRKDEPMYLLLGSKNRGKALVAPGYTHSATEEEARFFEPLVQGKLDASTNDRLFDVYWTGFGEGRPRR